MGNNIEVDLTKIGCENGKWMELGEDCICLFVCLEAHQHPRLFVPVKYILK
jgi:hypothetical protein